MKKLFRPSLKKKLVFLLSVGYAVPVLLIIGMLRDFITEQYDHQFLDKAQLSLVETTELATYYLSSMSEDSRRPTVEGDIQRAYTRYLEGSGAEDLYLVVESSLNRIYRDNSLFYTVALFHAQEELSTQYITNQGAEQQKAVTRVYEELYPLFMAEAETLGTSIGFFSFGNRLFMLRNLMDSSFDAFGLLVLEVNTGRMVGAFAGITGVRKVDLQFDDAFVDTDWLLEGGEIIPLVHKQSAEGHDVAVTLWVDIDQGQDALENFQEEMTQVLLLVFPAIGYMLYSFYLHVTRPLNLLMNAHRRVETGELGYQVDKIPDSEEIRALTQGFNKMSRSMKEQFVQSYQEQLALQDARVKTLQSQINPHFLNNTLEIINWETRIAGNNTASAMIESLSVMLRATMNREGKGKIPFEEELSYVDAYLYIQSCRMGARLTVETHIDPDSLHLLVPRLIFQPLVENACEHGIGGQKQGLIVISSFLSQENLIIEVKNSGKMPPDTEQRMADLLEWDESSMGYVSDANNLGIRNVNQRLKMMFGQVYGLDIFNNDEDMTVVRLALPKHIQEDDTEEETR